MVPAAHDGRMRLDAQHSMIRWWAVILAGTAAALILACWHLSATRRSHPRHGPSLCGMDRRVEAAVPVSDAEPAEPPGPPGAADLAGVPGPPGAPDPAAAA